MLFTAASIGLSLPALLRALWSNTLKIISQQEFINVRKIDLITRRRSAKFTFKIRNTREALQTRGTTYQTILLIDTAAGDVVILGETGIKHAQGGCIFSLTIVLDSI